MYFFQLVKEIACMNTFIPSHKSFPKYEISYLVAFIIEEDLWMAINQTAILCVVEMLSPHWIILNVFFLLVHLIF